MGSQSPLRVVIVGGVAGGMSAATRLRRLDEFASITVFESGPYVSFANCGIPYALSDVISDRSALLLQTPEGFKARFNIEVRVHHKVVAIDRAAHTVSVQPLLEGGPSDAYKVPYDKLILSQGAAPVRPDIPGAKLPHVFNLTTIEDLDAAKKHIATAGVKQACVVGGGFIGLEAVENLGDLNLEVSVLERDAHVLPPIDADMAEVVHAELRRQGVHLVLGKSVTAITPESVLTDDPAVKLPAQLVLLVLGVRPRTALARAAGLEIGKVGVAVNKHMQTSDPDIYAVGDMVETDHRIALVPRLVALAGPANRQGRIAADHVCGRTGSDATYRGSLGTAVCKVFNVTVGIAGLSVAALRGLQSSEAAAAATTTQDVKWVTAHPPDHAGYYPGAKAITLKVAFDGSNGKILGAQGVGISGVDKRIDVLATAMQGGMTVFDLEHLELAYAPPYGSAKDPVNMVGFIASNVMRGDVKVVHAEALDEAHLTGEGPGTLQVVDVRSPSEFARGHLKGAINIPVNELRGQIGKLDRNKKTLAYCQVGYRGYLAQRILVQEGFDADNLDGGFKSVAEGGFKQLQA